jgi:DNA-binding NarL/FixJ family response regulator
MIKILIADDHAIMREGLKLIVAQEIDMKVFGEAGSSNELFELLEKDSWDILILDINMPGKSGLDALKEIKYNYPKIPILILSMYSEEQYGIRSIKAGASGYLKKASAPEELVKAIRMIVQGGKYISSSLAEKMADILAQDYQKIPHENLSDREYQIMLKIASGKTAESIADELSISIHTVYSYRNRILEKLGVKSNVEITQYVLSNNLNE